MTMSRFCVARKTHEEGTNSEYKYLSTFKTFPLSPERMWLYLIVDCNAISTANDTILLILT